MCPQSPRSCPRGLSPDTSCPVDKMCLAKSWVSSPSAACKARLAPGKAGSAGVA